MNTQDIELPLLPRPQVPLIDADICLMDIRKLADWCERTAKGYARAAIELDRQRRGEPVAWMYEYEDGQKVLTTHLDTIQQSSKTWAPLYAAPQPSETVPSDEDLLAFYDARAGFDVRHPTRRILLMFRELLERYGQPAQQECGCCGKMGGCDPDCDAAQPAASVEPLVRYCPGCGSIGPVEGKYRDCCPDGNESRMIPQGLAEKCQATFRIATRDMLAEQTASDTAPVAAQPQPSGNSGEFDAALKTAEAYNADIPVTPEEDEEWQRREMK